MKDMQENVKIVNNFLENDFIEFIQDYFSIKINSNQYTNDFKKFVNGYQFYSDPLMETILQNSCEYISSLTKIKLVPTYSMVTMFMKDDIYEKEESESSEISAILFLGSSNDTNKISLNIDSIEYNLFFGDLIIYNSKELSIKNFSIKDKWLLQATLNFVDSEGEYSDYIYDKRSYLGFPLNIEV